MAKYTLQEKLALFKGHITGVWNKFAHNRFENLYVEKLPHLDEDSDAYDGVIIRPEGFFRVVRQKSNVGDKNVFTVLVLMSRSSTALKTYEENGAFQLSAEGVDGAYVLPVSFVLNSRYAPIEPFMVQRIHQEINEHCREMRRRSREYHTIHGADFSDPKNSEARPHCIFANAKVAYEIKPKEVPSFSKASDLGLTAHYSVMPEDLRGPVYADPVPFDILLHRNWLRRIFSRSGKISKPISYENSSSFEFPFHHMVMQFADDTSNMWNGRHAYRGHHGLFFPKAEEALKRWVYDHSVATTVTAVFSLAIGIGISPGAGLATIIATTVFPALVQKFMDAEAMKWIQGWGEAFGASRKKNILAYLGGEDGWKHFITHTGENFRRLCHKFNLHPFSGHRAFTADSLIPVPLRKTNMLPAHVKPSENMQPESLHGLLLNMENRGFSSILTKPGPDTKIHFFHNGVTCLKEKLSDGKIKMYARFDKDACFWPEHINPVLAKTQVLPEVFQDKFKDDEGRSRIIELIYDPKSSSFGDAFEQKFVESAEMEENLKETLFEANPDVSAAVRQRSELHIQQAFAGEISGAESEYFKEGLYRQGALQVMPYVEAAVRTVGDVVRQLRLDLGVEEPRLV